MTYTTKTKLLQIKKNMCIKFYRERQPLYLETDSSGVGLGVGLMWVREGMNYLHGKAPGNTVLCLISIASRHLSRWKSRYCSTEKETLSILNGLEKSQHYFLPMKST